MFFFFTPFVFYFLSGALGALIAGAIVIGLQLYYVKNHWKTVGTPYTVLLVAWLGTLLLPRFFTS